MAESSPDLVRVVVTMTFADPFNATVAEEYTYVNNSGKRIQTLTIEKGKVRARESADTLYSNLRFYSGQKVRLEILPSEGRTDSLQVLLDPPLEDKAQQTITMEYVYTARRSRARLWEK